MAPFLRLTGYRFSKAFRQADSGWRRAVYAVVSTPEANVLADMPSTQRRHE